jgi:hypothetical protein
LRFFAREGAANYLVADAQRLVPVEYPRHILLALWPDRAMVTSDSRQVQVRKRPPG